MLAFHPYIRWEVVRMTAYEIVMVVLGILGLLIAFGGFVVALLTFLDGSVKKFVSLEENDSFLVRITI